MSLRILRVVLLGIGWTAACALACPFCAKLSRSASDDIRESDAVVWATLTDDPETKSTAMQVLSVVKGHAKLGETSTIAADIEGTHGKPIERLVFGIFRQGEFVPSKIETVTEDYVVYLTTLTDTLDASQANRLTTVFGFLDSADQRTAADAYAEFAKSSYRSTALAARSFDPERIRGWLLDASVAPERVGLFGLLLGLCRVPEDVEFLNQLIDQAAPRHLPGLDGLLGGLCVLDRERGIDKTVSLLTAESSSPFRRMAAMACLTFVLTDLSIENQTEVLERTVPALRYPDVSGPLVDELRRGECWTALEAVLSLAESPRDRPAVIRYALVCPDARAKAFVRKIIAEQPIAIRDAEQAIEFEATARKLGEGL